MPNGQSDRHSKQRPPPARMVRCPECEGNGETECLECDGEGRAHVFGEPMLFLKCLECGGFGTDDCPLCTGDGVVTASVARGYREAMAKGRTKG